MSLDFKQKGRIKLHVISFNDQPLEEWITFFKSQEVIEAALSDPDCGIHNIFDSAAKERAENALKSLKGDFLTPTKETLNVPASNIETATVVKPLSETQSSRKQLPVVSGIIGNELLSTDKGCFFHTETWKLKLGNVYQHLEGFEEIFANACLEVGFDPTVDYVSEAKKKSVTAKLKKCAKDYLDNLADNL